MHAESVMLWLQVVHGVHKETPLSMKQNGRPVLTEGMTQLIYVLALPRSSVCGLQVRLASSRAVTQVACPSRL